MIASLAPLAIMFGLIGVMLIPGIIARKSFAREERSS